MKLIARSKLAHAGHAVWLWPGMNPFSISVAAALYAGLARTLRDGS
jgi:hypothetical protein